MTWKDILKSDDNVEGGPYDWGDAFVKYGMDDGYYMSFTYDVVETLEQAGYEVYQMEITGHNERITQIYKDDKIVYDDDGPRQLPQEIKDLLDKEYPNGLPKEKEVYDEKNPTREQVRQKLSD